MRPIFIATLLLTVPTYADVLVVDAASGPGTDFTDLQPAIDAAVDGDTVLVRSGTYLGFTLDGKSLVVISDASAEVHVASAAVANLALNQQVVLRGLILDGPTPGVAWLQVANCDGAVWVEDCTVAPAGQFAIGSKAGAYLQDSRKVTLTRVIATGEAGLLALGAGVLLQNADLYAFESEFTGSLGEFTASKGGPGLQVQDSQVWLSWCEVRGGQGLDGEQDPFGGPCFTEDGAGGDGLLISALPAVLRETQTTIEGGAHGIGCATVQGPPEAGIAGTLGFQLVLPGVSPQFAAASPVREFEAIDFTIRRGTAGHEAFAAFSLIQDPLWFAGFLGPTLSPLTSIIPVYAGQLVPGAQGNGTLDFSLNAPSVPASLGSIGFYAQSFFLSPQPSAYLGGGSHVTLLDAAF